MLKLNQILLKSIKLRKMKIILKQNKSISNENVLQDFNLNAMLLCTSKSKS